MADYEINAGKVILDLHDVLPAGELTEKRLQKIDTIFVKSKFHRSLYPTVPEEKFVVVPNGIIAEDYAGKAEKDPFLLVNTSSPDRSLSKLVKLFKRVKEHVPEAKCEWAYGWSGFEENVARRNPDAQKWMDDLKAEIAETDGFVDRGRVSQREVIEMYKRGRILAYPTEFAEIDCISARKAQAAGCLPITTDFAALNETVQYGVKLPSSKTKDTWAKPYQFDYAMDDALDDAWVEAVVAELRKPYIENMAMREDMHRHDWTRIADVWENVLI